MGFTVKATYRGETRRFTFSTNGHFPTYDQLYNQLYRVFPISHNYYLSKLLFSPKASQPSRLLIAQEVHSAEQYDSCLKPFAGRTWDDALLRFSVFDENPHKAPSQVPVFSAPVFKWSRDSLSLDGGGGGAFTPSTSALTIPSPVSIFDTPLQFPTLSSAASSTAPLPVPMEVDSLNSSCVTAAPSTSLTPPFVPFVPFIPGPPSPSGTEASRSTITCPRRETTEFGPQHVAPQHSQATQCCAVSQAKSDIQSLIENFKADLGQIVQGSLSAKLSETSTAATPAHSATMLPTYTDCLQHQRLVCVMCFKGLSKSWYKCSICFFNHMCEDCHTSGKAQVHQDSTGQHHVYQNVTCSDCPAPPLPGSWPSLPQAISSPTMNCSECLRLLQYNWYKCSVCYTHVLCHYCYSSGTKSHQSIFGNAHQHTLTTSGSDTSAPLQPLPAPMHPPLPPPPPPPVLSMWNPFSFGSTPVQPLPPVTQALNTPSIPLQSPSTVAPREEIRPLLVPIVPRSAETTPVEDEANVVHHGVRCDVCHKTIVGPRYKCLDCPDYDLCDEHMKSGSAEAHNPFHAFQKVPKARRLPVPAATSTSTSTAAPVVNTERSVYVHPGVTCDLCRGRVIGTRHKCDDCFDHDHCDTCWKSGSAERHNPYHTFTDIMPPASIVQSRVVPAPTSAPAPASLRTPASAAAPPLATEATPSSPRIHWGVTCDVCNGSVIGIRHKCLDCPNYDQCDECFKAGHPERHNPFHEFIPIEEPGRVVVHNVYSGDGERVPQAPRQNPAPTVVEAPPAAPAAVSAVVHSATCDFCDSRIVGVRYKCLGCPDFDVCSSCHPLTDVQHPSHAFVRVANADDIKKSTKRSEESRHSASCNFCYKVITGVRFKCMDASCPDVDLCSQCEALPIPVHPEHHPLLKMKTPQVLVPKVLRNGERVVPNSPTTPVVALQHPGPGLFNSSKFSEGYIFNPASSEAAKQPNPFDTPTRGRSVSPSPLFAYPAGRSHSPHEYSMTCFFPRKPSAFPEPRALEATTSELDPAAFWNQYVRRQSRSRTRSRSPRSHISYTERTRSPSLCTGSPKPMQDSPPTTPQTSFAQSELLELPSVPQTEPVLIVPLEDLPSVPRTEPVLVDVEETPEESPVKLPVLTLGSSHFEREFWPRVVDELKHLMQETESAALAAAITADPVPENEATVADPPVVEIITLSEAIDLGPEPTTETVAVVEDKPEPLPEATLSAIMVDDINIPPGQVFPPGAEFMKAWKMLNDGTLPWPASTELVFAAGDALLSGNEGLAVHVGAVAPDETVDIWTHTLKVPEAPGTYVSFWKLRDGEGKYFGRNIWIDITVPEQTNDHSDDSVESSLASSSVIMPESPAAKVAGSDAQSIPHSSPVASPVTALSTEYAMSDSGSDISLVSIPDSDDDDLEIWEDSRSQAIASPVAAVPNSAMEYVVLYEDSSASEED